MAIVFWSALAILVYAHVGYPLILRLVSVSAGRKGTIVDGSAPVAGHVPSVSLIVPAYNEESVLAAKLENALAIDYPVERLEILVASDGSSDGTVEIARSFESRGVRVLAFPQRRGKTAVLNDAVHEAAGDVLCLCDANVMFRPDALKRLVTRLDDPKVGAVSGDVRLASEESSFGEGESTYFGIERTVQMAESRIGSMMGVDGGMYIVRRELFQPLPPDTIVDDFVVSMRVIRQGKRVVYEPTAIATENATATARQEFRRRVRLSAGAMQVLKRGEWPPLVRPVALWQFVSHKALRWLGPVWLVMLLVASGVQVSGVGCQVSGVRCQGSGEEEGRGQGSGDRGQGSGEEEGRSQGAGVRGQRSEVEVAEAVVYQVAFGGQVVLYLTAVAATFSLRLRATRVGGIAFYFVMSHVAMAVGSVKGLFNWQRVTWQRTERGGRGARC